jgi:hypothetical protein
MKTFITSFLLLFLPLAGMTQQKDSTISSENKFYVGLGLTNITYHIYYDGPQTLWDMDVSSGRFTPLCLNFGYKADRASWQVGFAYGWNRFNESFTFLSNNVKINSAAYGYIL